MALRKGQAMIEFYSMLPIFKKWHDEDGYRSAKSLYDKAKNEKKITMEYQQFNTYFKRELSSKKEVLVAVKTAQIVDDATAIKQVKTEEKRVPKFGDDDWEPPILETGPKKSTPYNPHKNSTARKVL